MSVIRGYMVEYPPSAMLAEQTALYLRRRVIVGTDPDGRPLEEEVLARMSNIDHATLFDAPTARLMAKRHRHIGKPSHLCAVVGSIVDSPAGAGAPVVAPTTAATAPASASLLDRYVVVYQPRSEQALVRSSYLRWSLNPDNENEIAWAVAVLSIRDATVYNSFEAARAAARACKRVPGPAYRSGLVQRLAAV